MENLNNGFEENGNGIHEINNKIEVKKAVSSLKSQILEIERSFTFEGKDPFKFDIYGNPISWVSEEVKVTDDMGRVIFTQPNVKKPSFWSTLALKVVASKYFWGDQTKNQREGS